LGHTLGDFFQKTFLRIVLTRSFLTLSKATLSEMSVHCCKKQSSRLEGTRVSRMHLTTWGRFYETVSAEVYNWQIWLLFGVCSRVARFSWYNIPKRVKIYKTGDIYQVAIKYAKWPKIDKMDINYTNIFLC
jgi:hypothetical protein